MRTTTIFKPFMILASAMIFAGLAVAGQTNTDLENLKTFIKKTYSGQIRFKTGIGVIPVSFTVKFTTPPTRLNGATAYKSDKIEGKLLHRTFEGHLYATVVDGALKFQLDGWRDGRITTFFEAGIPWNEEITKGEVSFMRESILQGSQNDKNYIWKPNSRTAFKDCIGFIMKSS
jgi:hypothetical protein